MSDSAIENAKAWLETIADLASRIDSAEEEICNEAEEEAREKTLSVEVRDTWHAPGETDVDREYQVVLTTGGPGLRLVGDLSLYGEPENPRLQWQDWGTPWTVFPLTPQEERAVKSFLGVFTYGE
jgi:hypothetical protein